MNATLFFDFKVNKEEKCIEVTREFAAELVLVWDAWTNPEILDLWWAPKPYRNITKSMEFKIGGSWLYCMVSPENEKHWCRADYKQIEQHKMFSGLDAFCSELGEVNTEFPRSLWTNSFTDRGASTLVKIVLQYEALADLEKIIELGFKEGFTMALQNLDQYIASRQKLQAQYKTGTQERVCTYLNFPGTTEKAFNFYKSVFKTDFIGGGIQRFGDLPADSNHPPVAENVKKMILHVELPITPKHILMGTDAPKEMGFTVIEGNNMHISIEPDSREEANRLFNELGKEGKVTMPLQDMFWGAYFGSFTDKFGINWMINYISKSSN